MNPGGFMLFNTIINNKEEQARNDYFEKLLDTGKVKIRRLSKIEGNNELFITFEKNKSE